MTTSEPCETKLRQDCENSCPCSFEEAMRLCWVESGLSEWVKSTGAAETNRLDFDGTLQNQVRNYATISDVGQINGQQFSNSAVRTHRYRLLIKVDCKLDRALLAARMKKFACCRRQTEEGKILSIRIGRLTQTYDRSNAAWEYTGTFDLTYSTRF